MRNLCDCKASPDRHLSAGVGRLDTTVLLRFLESFALYRVGGENGALQFTMILTGECEQNSTFTFESQRQDSIGSGAEIVPAICHLESR